MYRAVTHDISVSVEPVYLDQQSEPDFGRYVWAYHILIENSSDRTVQLQSRYWRIVDPQSGRHLFLFIGLPADNALRHHGRPLPDAR
jgi:uncharacterized protein affecting Mg2+/Co2+ transport